MIKSPICNRYCYHDPERYIRRRGQIAIGTTLPYGVEYYATWEVDRLEPTGVYFCPTLPGGSQISSCVREGCELSLGLGQAV